MGPTGHTLLGCAHGLMPSCRAASSWLRRRHQGRLQARVLAAWRLHLAQRTDLGRRLGLQRCQHLLQQAFHVLQDRVRAGAAQQQVVEHARVRAAAQLLRTVLGSWREQVRRKRAARAAALTLLCAAHQRQASCVLSCWASWARGRTQLAASGQQLIRLRAFHLLLRTFTAWAQHASCSQAGGAASASPARAGARWHIAAAFTHQCLLRQSLQGWQRWLVRQARRRCLLPAAQQQRPRRLMQLALVCLSREAMLCKGLAMQGAALAAGLQQLHMQACLQAWAQQAGYLQELRAKAQLLTTLVAERAMRVVVQAWSRHSQSVGISSPQSTQPAS